MKKILLVFVLNFVIMFSQAQNLFPDLQKYCESLPKEFAKIPNERKENLQKIADFIKEKYSKNETINLTVICTHNSRRSQFGQVWAKIAAVYYDFDAQKIQTFSGGTEATACNPRTVLALQRAGVKVEQMNQIAATVANNPRYEVRLSEKELPFYLFSKKYNDAQNPQTDFCAILVCSSADEACPIVFGATQRIYHGYEDPKRADNQANESEIYDQTCHLIASEMFYVFSIIQK
ncbi:MAG: protein-tyrosine-phosphatase [Bacteroidetes bacterium]|nr:MAG: protein-tyrosine-phosphatase [Bacteroidota bacterium]